MTSAVSHLVADLQPNLTIDDPLMLGELFDVGPPCAGRCPTRELVVAPLRMAVTMAMNAMNADPLALVVV